MVYESGDLADHDHEMEDVRWVAFDEAQSLLAYDGARNVVRKALEMLTTGEGQT